MVGLQLGALAGDDLGEVHLELVGDLVDHADGHVLAVLLIGSVELRADAQLRRQRLDAVIADLAQLPKPRADLAVVVHPSLSFDARSPRRCTFAIKYSTRKGSGQENILD